MCQQDVEMSASSKLYQIAAKLKSLAHLFENQSEPQYADTQWDQIYWGLGTLFGDISQEVHQLAIRCENDGA